MFSASVLDHFHNPRNTEPLLDFTHYGVAGIPGDGPSMELWFRVEAGVIEAASYRTYPCPAAIACGSMTAEIAKKRTVEQMQALTAPALVTLLGGLPEGKEHCPRLAAEAVRRAFLERGVSK